MEIYVKISIDFHIFSFSDFQSLFYHIHWWYPHRSFKHSKWRRHKRGHT